MSDKKVKGIDEPCCKQASEILNLSQGNSSQTQNSPHLVGHPRYHVLCSQNHNKAEILDNLESLGCTEVVTEQQGNTKTAFLNQEDQNRVLHEILTSEQGRQAINRLNEGETEVILRTPTSQLTKNRYLMMSIVKNGTKMQDKPANSTVLILGHHKNMPEGTYVHVKTFYPTE